MNREHKKLERLMLFSEVASRLSFTAAAEQLGISRGYLSDQIKRLEQELGIALLIRSTRSVRLTEEGERVRQQMVQVHRSLLDLQRNIQQDRTPLAGPVRITAPKLFADRFLLDICHAFQQQHPAVRFSIDCSYTSHDLNLSNFDLAFRATNTPPQNMVARALLPYRHCCCASPGYLQRQGRPSAPRELSNHQCLRAPDTTEWLFKSGNIDVEGWLAVNDHQMLKQQALQGRGIIYVAEYLVDKEINAGQLERILEGECSFSQTIYIIHPQLVRQSERLKAFLEFTREWFGQSENEADHG